MWHSRQNTHNPSCVYSSSKKWDDWKVGGDAVTWGNLKCSLCVSDAPRTHWQLQRHFAACADPSDSPPPLPPPPPPPSSGEPWRSSERARWRVAPASATLSPLSHLARCLAPLMDGGRPGRPAQFCLGLTSRCRRHCFLAAPPSSISPPPVSAFPPLHFFLTPLCPHMPPLTNISSTAPLPPPPFASGHPSPLWPGRFSSIKATINKVEKAPARAPARTRAGRLSSCVDAACPLLVERQVTLERLIFFPFLSSHVFNTKLSFTICAGLNFDKMYSMFMV